MLPTVKVNGRMVVVVSVKPNKWGYLIVTLGSSPGVTISCTMVDRSLTSEKAVDAAIITLTQMGVI